MSEREKEWAEYQAWKKDFKGPIYFHHWDQWIAEFGFAVWQASRRAALEEAHTVCLAGVKWSPEPTKHVQFYVNGTCHRLAAEISQLAKETNNG